MATTALSSSISIHRLSPRGSCTPGQKYTGMIQTPRASFHHSSRSGLTRVAPGCPSGARRLSQTQRRRRALRVNASADPSSAAPTLVELVQQSLRSLPHPDLPSTGALQASSRVAQDSASAAWNSLAEAVSSLAQQTGSALGSIQLSNESISNAASSTSSAFAGASSSLAGAASTAVQNLSSGVSSGFASSAQTPEALAKLLNSEQGVIKDLKDVVALAAGDSARAIAGAVEGVSGSVASAPTVVRLESAGLRALEDVSKLASSLGSAVSSLGFQVADDPALALSTLSEAIQSAPGVVGDAVVSSLASAAATPGAIPASAVGAATLTGLLFSKLLSVLKEAQAKGSELPSRYDPDVIIAYFKLRPTTVLARALTVFAQVSQLVATIYIDRAKGLEKENERLRARQTVELITRLGPTAIKVGQALSIRPDLLSLAYLEELQTLQDRVASFSNEEAQDIIREGLGKDPEEVFMDMSPSPVAAASLGQVYKAKLRKSGETVAVKVQRPDVLEGICCDLLVLRIVALVLQKLPYVHTDLLDVLDTFARRFFDELDYIQEGKNGIRFAASMASIENITVPTVYMDYTSRKVLTTGWVEGEKLSECQSADLGTLVTTALNCYLIQLLETGFLHADPHPGNLLRTPDGKLCILDYGLMTEVTTEQQYALIEYISHLVNSDYERVAEDLVVLGFVPPELVDPEKTAAVVPKLSKVLGQLTQGGGAKKINVAQVTDDLASLSSEYVFVIPPYFALILRAFGVLEGIGLDHDPDYSIVDECYPYISKRLLTDNSPRARRALRYFLYGKEDKLNVTRVEEMAQGLLTFQELMAAGAAPKFAGRERVILSGPEVEDVDTAGARAALAAADRRGNSASMPAAVSSSVGAGAGTGQGNGSVTGASVVQRRKGLVDPTTKQVLSTVFSVQGSYFQELLLTELVKTVDALSREALAEQWSAVAARSFFPVPQSLIQPGTYPLPLLLPGAVTQLARGTWRTASLSEEDQETLSTVRRLWAFLEPRLESSNVGVGIGPQSTQDIVPWFREAAPVAQELLPGVLTTGTRFLAMLAQRQALRLADDLDGGKSVDEWDSDPYSFARSIRPPSSASSRD